MSLLNKFKSTTSKLPKQTRDGVHSDAHLANIIANLQSILQGRRSLEQLNQSGLQDFSELLVGEALINHLCQDIQQQISLHEKRLHSVQVKLADSSANRWQLSVSAKLACTPTSSSQSPQGNRSVNFILDIAKRTYLESKQAMNGVFL
ncbi:GPW/gp25 family protein [Paraglaciecola marina]|uniref:GPW/gp25 family protein n=1 Tax=Paraglaciecola marina TaxID=2500157 RepID=UPI00105F4F1B|nr:GPW/gp25 family protein [Paraglaciecola marina]